MTRNASAAQMKLQSPGRKREHREVPACCHGLCVRWRTPASRVARGWGANGVSWEAGPWSVWKLFVDAYCNIAKEGKARRNEFPSDIFSSFFFFFLSFSAQNVNLGFEDSTRSGMNAEIISAFCYYIYLFPPPPCSRTVTVQADKSKHEKTPTQPAFFWNYKFVMQRFGLWTFHLTVWVFILHLLWWCICISHAGRTCCFFLFFKGEKK